MKRKQPVTPAGQGLGLRAICVRLLRLSVTCGLSEDIQDKSK